MKTREAANGKGTMATPRARRYGMNTAILYRVCGENTWQRGVLKNISISGVLIATDAPLNKGTNIEMRFTLPLELKDRQAADVACRGCVVRSEEDDAIEGMVNVAAQISYSRLIRQAR